MNKVVKARLLTGLFVLGVLLYPAWHKAHCADDCQEPISQTAGSASQEHSEAPGNSDHKSDQCPTCQLAASPFQMAVVLVSSVVVEPLSCAVSLLKSLPVVLAPIGVAAARAPPVV